MSRRQEHLLALVLVAAVVAAVCLGLRYYTFRLFFAWPTGGVWPNFVQAALWVFAGWYLRDHLGRGLVGWLHRHHAPRMREVMDEHHRDNLEGELREIRAAIRSIHRRLDGD